MTHSARIAYEAPCNFGRKRPKLCNHLRRVSSTVTFAVVVVFARRARWAQTLFIPLSPFCFPSTETFNFQRESLCSWLIDYMQSGVNLSHWLFVLHWVASDCPLQFLGWNGDSHVECVRMSWMGICSISCVDYTGLGNHPVSQYDNEQQHILSND